MNMPAPLRSDLHGDDLIYEIELALSKLQPGDTLRIDRVAVRKAGGDLSKVAAPVYPHRRWKDEATTDLCVCRL